MQLRLGFPRCIAVIVFRASRLCSMVEVQQLSDVIIIFFPRPSPLYENRAAITYTEIEIAMDHQPPWSIAAEASVPIAKAPTTSARPPPAAKAPKDSAPPKVASPSPQREPESMEVDLTVEQYLSVECDRMAAQITVRKHGRQHVARDAFVGINACPGDATTNVSVSTCARSPLWQVGDVTA